MSRARHLCHNVFPPCLGDAKCGVCLSDVWLLDGGTTLCGLFRGLLHSLTTHAACGCAVFAFLPLRACVLTLTQRLPLFATTARVMSRLALRRPTFLSTTFPPCLDGHCCLFSGAIGRHSLQGPCLEPSAIVCEKRRRRPVAQHHCGFSCGRFAYLRRLQNVFFSVVFIFSKHLIIRAMWGYVRKHRCHCNQFFVCPPCSHSILFTHLFGTDVHDDA